MVDEYELPYSGLVPPDPSFDDMHEVVCQKGLRPDIPLRWYTNDVSDNTQVLSDRGMFIYVIYELVFLTLFWLYHACSSWR